jgi:hypothetical protein
MASDQEKELTDPIKLSDLRMVYPAPALIGTLRFSGSLKESIC